MATILGVAMKKGWKRLTKSYFLIFRPGLVFLEPLDAISNIEAKLEKAWQLAALNNSTGSLSAGFSGMVVALYTKISTKEFVSIILEKLRLLTIKEN